jgi:divalent anion:Na+ symporter, DASS family
MAAGLALLVSIYLFVTFLIPRPPGVDANGWSLFGLFTATVAGLITQPVPGGALVLMAVVLSPLVGGLTLERALSGFGDSTVWLVMAAFFISRSLLNTGLARRIALFFVRTFGGNSLGVCYALSMSDVVLATVIPSNGARSGGVVLPIVRSISELYGSRPGETAGLIGSFLFVGVYQSICISSAMFLTGQASNPLAARMAASTGFEVTWIGWFLAGLVPGLLSLLLVPLVILRMNPPSIRRTPEAAAFAGGELAKMGPMSSNERILAAVFIAVCLMWMSTPLHRVDITLTALLGSVALLLTGVLTWEDVRSERAAWDIFIWYGGLVMLGRALNDAKVTTAFAQLVGAQFGGLGWPLLFAIALLIYFYAHYGFASNTAHMLAMFPAFLAVLVAQGAPPGLVTFAFACATVLSSGLTNYGTTPAPMFFAHGYVGLKEWWKIGAVCAVVNLLIWTTVGFSWWKVLGIW